MRRNERNARQPAAACGRWRSLPARYAGCPRPQMRRHMPLQVLPLRSNSPHHDHANEALQKAAALLLLLLALAPSCAGGGSRVCCRRHVVDGSAVPAARDSVPAIERISKGQTVAEKVEAAV